MQNQAGKYHRKKYIINPKFQYFMLGFSLFQSFVTIGIIYVLNMRFFDNFKLMGQQANIPENHIYFQFLKEQQTYMSHALVEVCLLISASLIVSVVVLSHRNAGPIYRITKHMNEISDGKELSDVHFRKKDFFPELAQTFNRMGHKLKRNKKNDDQAA